MSRIIAKVVDRTIEFTDMPPIYSGSKNVDDIQFQFDSEWSTFKKTAVFYRSEDNQFMKELTSDICTIPHEVLSRDGKIYIGVFGELDDKVITSEVFIYTISRGALTDPVSSDDPTFWDKLLEIKNDILQAKEDAHAYADEAKEWAKQAEQNAGHFYNGIIAQGETYSGIASNKGIKLHSVKGKTSQKTTNGYQLLDISKKQVGMLHEDGSLNSRNDAWEAVLNMPCEPESGYIVSEKNKGYYFQYRVCFYDEENTFISYLDIARSGIYSRSFTSPANAKFISISWSIIVGDSAIQREEIMLNKGATAKPYEQFTGGQPAPNPDYAMPIENVEISKIYTSLNNILENTSQTSTINGVTFTVNKDGSVNVNGTATIQAEKTIGSVQLLANVEYTMKCSDLSNDTLIIYFKIGDNKYVIAGQTSDKVTFTLDSNLNASIVLAVRKNASFNNKIAYPQINIGNNALPYEQFKGATVETSLTLAQDDIYQQGTITRARKQITFDGSSDESWIYDLESYRFVIPIGDSLEYQNKRIPVVCNRGVFRELGTEVGTTFIGASHNFYYTPSRDITTKEAFKTWLSTHNLVVEYELATQTTEEFKVPTIPSYYPYTNVSTDNDLTTDMEWELLGNSDNSLEIEDILKRVEALESKAIGG